MRRKSGTALLIGLLTITSLLPSTAAAQAQSGGSMELPITGTFETSKNVGPLTEFGSGTVSGTLEVTRFVAQNGEIVALGTLTMALTNTAGQTRNVITTFATPVQASGVNDVAAAQASGSCQILNLELNPLHLDLLGLVVDLSAVELLITAQQGPGNLLGNLLCAITGLLDPSGGGGGGGGRPQETANLLNQMLGLL